MEQKAIRVLDFIKKYKNGVISNARARNEYPMGRQHLLAKEVIKL